MPSMTDLIGSDGVPVALEDTDHSSFVEGDSWRIALEVGISGTTWEPVDLSGAAVSAVVSDPESGAAIVTLTAPTKTAGGSLVLSASASATTGAAGAGSADRPAMLHVRLSQSGEVVSLILAPITIRQAGM